MVKMLVVAVVTVVVVLPACPGACVGGTTVEVCLEVGGDA
jgi:hypothetical protein